MNIYTPYECTTLELHKSARLDKLKIRRLTHLLNAIFKLKSKYGITVTRVIQTRACRQISFPVSRPNLKVYENSPYYIGSELWLILPAHIKEITDKKLFDCHIREWLRMELVVD